MTVSMATANLFFAPRLQGRRADLQRPRRAPLALQKVLRRDRPRAELGATLVFWGGREGVETDAAKPAVDALERYREASTSSARTRSTGLRHALRDRAEAQRAARRHLPADRGPRPGLHRDARPLRDGRCEPRGGTRDDGRALVPARRRQALWAGKLFHIDLNGQRIGRYDQDFRFGAGGLKDGFFLVRLLEDSGYDGAAALRRAPAAGGERAGSLGLRRRLHAHVSRAQGDRRPHERGRRDHRALEAAKVPEPRSTRSGRSPRTRPRPCWPSSTISSTARSRVLQRTSRSSSLWISCSDCDEGGRLARRAPPNLSLVLGEVVRSPSSRTALAGETA